MRWVAEEVCISCIVCIRCITCIELNVEYTNDPESAIEVHRKYWAGTYFPALLDQKIYTPEISQENSEAVGPDTIKKSGCVSANPDDHLRFAQKYIELGFTHLIFHSAAEDQRGFLERFGRDILPRLR